MKYDEYIAYLRSDGWKKKRTSMLKQTPYCVACFSIDRLHVHHMTYRRLGEEKLKNLKVLCEACHFRLHDGFKKNIARVGRKRDDLIIFTRRFVKKIRKEHGKTHPERIRQLNSSQFNDEQSPVSSILELE